VLGVVMASGAQASGPIRPGSYIGEGGWGSLTLKQGQQGSLSFQLETTGANGHTCELAGEVRGGLSKIRVEEVQDECVVEFTAQGRHVKVRAAEGESNLESCRRFCGARAHFDNLYLEPAQGCSREELRRTRSEFKRLYDAGQHASARALLEPLLTRCDKTLFWIERGHMQNDLAITQYRLKDYAGCLATLKPLAADAASVTDDSTWDCEICRGPTDSYMFRPIAAAARTNIRLCRRGR
jgi:hypothetical protein